MNIAAGTIGMIGNSGILLILLRFLIRRMDHLPLQANWPRPQPEQAQHEAGTLVPRAPSL